MLSQEAPLGICVFYGISMLSTTLRSQQNIQSLPGNGTQIEAVSVPNPNHQTSRNCLVLLVDKEQLSLWSSYNNNEAKQYVVCYVFLLESIHCTKNTQLQLTRPSTHSDMHSQTHRSIFIGVKCCSCPLDMLCVIHISFIYSSVYVMALYSVSRSSH